MIGAIIKKMSTDIKCPYCGQTALRNVSYSSNTTFSAKHKCRRCKMIFPITIMTEVIKTIDTQSDKVLK